MVEINYINDVVLDVVIINLGIDNKLTISLKRLYIINKQNEKRVQVYPNKVCSLSNCVKHVYKEVADWL